MTFENATAFAPLSATQALVHGIQLSSVEKYYGSFHAVKDVNFTLAKGEFLTLLGPSGSGKTTTLMMVAGFESPTSGQITVKGRDVVDLPPKSRNFGIVFQGYALFPHKTALENVEFPLKMRGMAAEERRQLAKEILERVGLGTMTGRKPREMSGGQQQRVALARALVFKPDALLLDEPLGALDKNMREKMQDEIKSLQRELGISILFVTHDQEEAMSMSDRIAVMNNGMIVQIGTPTEVYTRPNSSFVAGFLGETNMFTATLETVQGTRAQVRLATGEVNDAQIMSPSAEYALGQQYNLSIRPERIHFLSSGQKADWQYEAKLLQHTFLGRHWRSIIEINGQKVVLINETSVEAQALKLSAIVQVGWSSEDAQLLAC